MTSANFYTGYSVDKSTSRVLAPPGGRSNNIFGGYEEPTPTVQKVVEQQQHQETSPSLTAAQEAAINKQTNKSGINLFDQSPTTTNNNDSSNNYSNEITHSHKGHGAIRPQDNSQLNIFGDTKKEESGAKVNDRQKSTIFANEQPAPQNANRHSPNKPRTGYNTITGQTYEIEEQQRQDSNKVYVQHQKDVAAAEKSRPIHTSSRVLQPPGGRSNGPLW